MGRAEEKLLLGIIGTAVLVNSSVKILVGEDELDGLSGVVSQDVPSQRAVGVGYAAKASEVRWTVTAWSEGEGIVGQCQGGSPDSSGGSEASVGSSKKERGSRDRLHLVEMAMGGC